MMGHAKMSRRAFLATSTAVALCRPLRAAPPRDYDFTNRKTFPTRLYSRTDYPVLYRKAGPLSEPSARYTGFKRETVILKKGTIRRPGGLPLPCDIVLDRDVAVTLRDGTKIYTDIFRPTGNGRSPVIILWSPYGKQVGCSSLDDMAGRATVPISKVSGLQKFEGLDPAYWVQQGYAIANVDARGAYRSDGNIACWGRQTAEDGCDFVEWCGTQRWSSGRVAMAGNSWLCISQWFVAAERPPHLTCIAPWEGMTDAYRDTMVRGGIPAPFARDSVLQNLAGRGYVEDVSAMAIREPLFNEYWDDKVARLERIVVPAYVLASYTNGAHAHGGFEGYRRIASKQKWLRVHNTHEWPDLYQDESVEDLRRFFDHFLKDANNGWQDTPPIRLSVLDPGGEDVVGRVEHEFPLARTQYRKFYLSGDDGSTGLKNDAPKSAATLRYPATENNGHRFAMRFDQETEVTGYMNLHLWVEADGSDDMDLAVEVQKLDRNGRPVTASLSYPKPLNPIVATGFLRVSLRALDTQRSTEAEPFLSFTKEQRLQAGEVVPVQISLWPISIRFHPGEWLELVVRPHNPVDRAFSKMGQMPIPVPIDAITYPPDQPAKLRMMGGPHDPMTLTFAVPSPRSRNKGTHIIHVGGERASYLLVPLIG